VKSDNGEAGLFSLELKIAKGNYWDFFYFFTSVFFIFSTVLMTSIYLFLSQTGGCSEPVSPGGGDLFSDLNM